MASSTVRQMFVCHFCFAEFRDRSTLISHFSSCDTKLPIKRHEEPNNILRITKTDRDILHTLKLVRRNEKLQSRKPKPNASHARTLISSRLLSFDDAVCSTSDSSLFNNTDQSDEKISSNNLNTKSSVPCHIYKYSRREQKNFYASVRRARLKRQYTTTKKFHIKPFIFNGNENFFINLPTKINSRQRLNTNSNNSFPLLFDPNFHTLVQLSRNNLFQKYFSDINHYFQVINSIASQEFQVIVNSNDNQHHVSYTAYSFINILRQTMADYSASLQRSFKRNYFQSFQHHESQVSVVPSKLRRCEQAISSHVSNDNSYDQSDDPTDSNTPSQDSTIIDFMPIEVNDTSHPILHPVQSDKTRTNHQNSINSPAEEPVLPSDMPIVEERTVNRSPSPSLLKKQKLEALQSDLPRLPIERARICIINGPNVNKNRSRSDKNISKSTDHVDENSLIKSTRMNTRNSAIKAEVITNTNPSFETKPVILTSNEISKEWSKHNVFYRCHACSHEEFFAVLSRECINLHISSKHGNMEDNFKQRLSHFLNNKGRSLKIFQHYLKWQKPWPEKHIEQIFKLSNKV